MDIFKMRCVKAHVVRKNVVCSPLSLEFALHMVAAGTKGETLLQILQFIGFKGNQLDSMEDLNLKSSAITRVASSEEDPEEPELSFANGVWVDKHYSLKSSYKELMTSIYNAKAESAEILSPGEPLCAALILVNALYFKGLLNTSSKFDEQMTVDKDFHRLDGSKISVPFMSRGSPLLPFFELLMISKFFN